MAAHPTALITVEGHADATGRERQNVLLSYQRAKVVEEWLQNAGLPTESIRINAAGSSGAKGLAMDRRASLKVDGVNTCKDVEGGD